MKLLFQHTLLIAVFGLFMGCSAESTAQSQAQIQADEFEKLMADNKQLVDVRTPGEFSQGHIPGATNINLHDDSFNDRVSQLDKSEPVMVYCAVGGRSATAASRLRSMGFKVYDLKGGIRGWSAQGKQVVKN